MAARAAERRANAEVVAQAERVAREEAPLAGIPEERWHGRWHHGDGTSMMDFPSVRCVGCGLVLGVTCYAIDPDEPDPALRWWENRPPEPDWPFESKSCPLCRRVREERAKWRVLSPPGEGSA